MANDLARSAACRKPARTRRGVAAATGRQERVHCNAPRMPCEAPITGLGLDRASGERLTARLTQRNAEEQLRREICCGLPAKLRPLRVGGAADGEPIWFGAPLVENLPGPGAVSRLPRGSRNESTALRRGCRERRRSPDSVWTELQVERSTGALTRTRRRGCSRRH
jgi:hypothetical protein